MVGVSRRSIQIGQSWISPMASENAANHSEASRTWTPLSVAPWWQSKRSGRASDHLRGEDENVLACLAAVAAHCHRQTAPFRALTWQPGSTCARRTSPRPSRDIRRPRRRDPNAVPRFHDEGLDLSQPTTGRNVDSFTTELTGRRQQTSRELLRADSISLLHFSEGVRRLLCQSGPMAISFRCARCDEYRASVRSRSDS